jgi:outer membrane protein assembly factor BamD (BamD/ComL family)
MFTRILSVPARVMLIAMTAAVMAAGQARPQEETSLYDRALRLIEAGQFERARLSLDTLLNAYPKTALRAEARAAIRTSWVRQGIVDPDPMLLFQEGQTRLTAGKREGALIAFQTLLNVYPASEYAEKARQAIKALEPKD